MWTVVYLAQKEEIAEKLRARLEKNGLLVKVRPAGGDKDNTGFEVLVPETEVGQAHGIIIDTDF